MKNICHMSLPVLLPVLMPALLSEMLANGAPALAASNDTPLEEIVVHAQKREQKLIDAPVSISVVGDTAINDWTLASLEDLDALVPNFKAFSQFAYNNTLALRGVGTFSRNIGFDERVGLYLDGIYLGPSYGLNQTLLDVAQVEVLRGPQGTFFGRNAIAGAVTLISRKPDGTRTGRALARLGNRGLYIVEGQVALPLSETLSASFSAGLHKRDGLTRNLFDGTGIDSRNRNNMRAQLLYRSSGDFEAHLSLDRNELDERMLIGAPNSDTFGIFPNTATQNDFEVDFNTAPTQRVVTQGIGLRLKYVLDNGAELLSLTGLRSTDVAHRNDTDYSRIDLLTVEYAEDYSHLSQELRLTSPEGEGTIAYVFGITYLDQRGRTDRHAIAGADASIIGVAPGSDMANFGTVDTKAFGLYGNLDFPLATGLTLSTGLRWSRDQKEVDWTIDTTGAPFFFLATGTLADKRHDTDLSPAFALTYEITGNLTAFARYAEGYKSGGYNLDYVSAMIFPDQLEFKKEIAQSYEAGFKGNLWDGKGRFSATFFWADYQDYQVNQFLDQGGGSTVIIISNAAKVHTKGLEFELAVNPVAGLSIAGSMALLDAEYRQFENGGTGGTDVSGNALDSPDFEASLSVHYERPVTDDLTGFLSGAFAYANGYFTTPDNITAQPLLGGGSVAFGRISSRRQLVARLGLEDTLRGWRLALWAKNGLNDTGTASSLRDFFGTIVEAPIEPRSYGLEVGYRF